MKKILLLVAALVLPHRAFPIFKARWAMVIGLAGYGLSAFIAAIQLPDGMYAGWSAGFHPIGALLYNLLSALPKSASVAVLLAANISGFLIVMRSVWMLSRNVLMYEVPFWPIHLCGRPGDGSPYLGHVGLYLFGWSSGPVCPRDRAFSSHRHCSRVFRSCTGETGRPDILGLAKGDRSGCVVLAGGSYRRHFETSRSTR
jgi:hypothetical protein